MKYRPLLYILLALLSSCSHQQFMQHSETVSAFEMSEEAKQNFIETNPCQASFSITPIKFVRDTCTAIVTFQGFPTTASYTLFCLNTGDRHNLSAMHSLKLSGDTALSFDDKETSTVTISFCALPGFEATWYLWADDESIRLSKTVSAKPLEAVGEDGARFSIIRKEAGGNLAQIVVTGLLEHEQVCVLLRSLNYEMVLPIKASEKGRLKIPFRPSACGVHDGVTRGTTKILLVREKETLELPYDWDLSTTTSVANREFL